MWNGRNCAVEKSEYEILSNLDYFLIQTPKDILSTIVLESKAGSKVADYF